MVVGNTVIIKSIDLLDMREQFRANVAGRSPGPVERLKVGLGRKLHLDVQY